MKRRCVPLFILIIVLCLSLITPSLADVLTLPAGLKVIEQEAFYGDTSLDEVVLPEGIEEIGEKAFANSSLNKINLPSSLNKIAENAFDSDADIEMTADEGSDVWQWAVDHDYIDDPDGYLLLNGQRNLAMTIYDEEDIRIFASKGYTASSDADWLTVWLSSRNNIMNVEASDNTTGSNRIGHVTVKSGRNTATLTVTQPDTTPKLTVPNNLSKNASSPTNVGSGALFFEGYGCGIYVQAKSGNGWSEEYEFDMTISSNTVFTDFIDPEYMAAGTTYRLRVSDKSGRSTDYYVKRSSSSTNSATLSKTEMTFPAASSSNTLKLTTSGSWSATADTSWLSISPSSGSKVSRKEITINASANNTGNERSGYISFKVGSVVCAKMKVTQVGNDTVFVSVNNQTPAENNESLQHLDGSGESVYFYPFAPGTISISSNDSWLTAKKATVQPGYSISVTADENTTGACRTGSVTFTYGSAQQTVYITQEPMISKPVINSPELSRTSDSPTVMKYRDLPMTVQWDAVTFTDHYKVILRYYTDTGSTASYSTIIPDDGSSSYRATLPLDWFNPEYTNIYRVVVYAYDQYEHFTSSGYSYFMTEPVPAAEQVVIQSPITDQLAVGDHVQLSANVMPEDANQAVEWQSSATDIAAVNESGYIEALSEGTATITATAAGTDISDSIQITVAEYTIETGTGEITGRVMNASDHSTAISGATVKLLRGSALYATKTTDSTGNYSISNLPAGSYRIIILAPGFIDFVCYTTIQDNEVTYMENFLLIAGNAGQTGTISGRITNAITNANMPLEGVRLKVRSGWNNINSGNAVHEDITDQNGAYSFTLPAGNYTINAAMTGYMDTHINVCIIPGEDTTDQNIPMLPPVTEGEFRIELRWGADPSDLDSHLTGTLRNSDSFHVYYSSYCRHGDINSDAWVKDGLQNVAVLDVDDTSSYGPEVITLNPSTNGPYYYYVHHFSGNGTLSTSDAKVNVYQNDRLVRTYNVPTDTTAQEYWDWNVFAIINGRIVTRNTITSSPELQYAESSYNQSVSSSGMVRDEQGNPLQHALVVVSDSNGIVSTTIADDSGKWWFDELPLDVDYHISCYLNDYTFEEKSVRITNRGTVIDPFVGIYAPEDKPSLSFTMTPSQINVGEEITFEVSAPGSTRVKLLIDGATYDEDTHNLDANGNATFTRKITKYAETRTVCFIAEQDGKWSNTSEAQTLYMTSNGNLNPVQIDTLPDPHRAGNNLTVSWSTVDYADGYNVYLYDNETGTHILYKNIITIDEERKGVIIPAADLPEGHYSLEVMAYGFGYSQSSASASLWVRPPYTEKTGWPQGEKVPTYVLENGEMKRMGYVDYTESVRILDEIDGYYYIEMHRSPEYGGDYVRRYVKKNNQILIGEDSSLKWEPELSLQVELANNDNGTVTITIITNGADEAGVKLGDTFVARSYDQKETYSFTFNPESGSNEYVIYAAKGEQNKSINQIIALNNQHQITVPESLKINCVISEGDAYAYGTPCSVSTNVDPDTGEAMSKLNDWKVSYTVEGNDQGLLAFAIDYHNEEPVYQYVSAGIKQADGTYLFKINPHKYTRAGFRVNPAKEDGYQHFEYDYVFVPTCLTQQVGHGYYIDHETIEYLINYGKSENRTIIEKRRHYFIEGFSDDVYIAHIHQSLFTDNNQPIENLKYDAQGALITEYPYKYKISKLIIDNRRFYAVYSHIYNFSSLYFVLASEAEKGMKDVAVADQFNIEIYKTWMGAYEAKVSDVKPLTTDLSEMNTSTYNPNMHFYLVAKWNENNTDHYKIIKELTWIKVTSEGLITHEPYILASLTSLTRGREYSFAVVCSETTVTANDDAVKDTPYIYSYYIPAESISEKDEAIKMLVYAYDHNLNALTGKNLSSGLKDSRYCEHLDLFIQYVSNRIKKCGLEDTEASAIINQLKTAPNPERNLYLFSIWDYEVRLNVNKTLLLHTSTQYVAPVIIWGGNNIEILTTTYGTRATRMRDFITTWFHESGHAADYNDSRYSGGYTTRQASVYDTNMVKDFKNQVYKAANNTRLDSRVATETYTSTQTDIIANCMMDNCRGDCGSYKTNFNNSLTSAQKSQGCSWNQAYEKTKDMLKTQMQEYYDRFTSAERNALMFCDAELGMMDNLLNDQKQFPTHEDGYWYTGFIRNGKQETEAFAEFFASRIMGVGETVNRFFFPSTCCRFDVLISLAVSNYRTKYNDYATDLGQ